MDVDPRLQLSDLTDYHFQASLAQQYTGNYNNTNNQQQPKHANYSTNSSYFQPVPDDEARTSIGRSIVSLYQPTSIPNASRGFNPGRAQIAQNPSPTQTPESTEVKDPTSFVPPHLQAPMKTNPPNLREWRNKFFDIEEPLLLTEEQYLTYFPHVDNVYSHRSTQKYKRKPFVSHYWDCRLKGRPTGTPMNRKKDSEALDEPEKKKRKRKVRERDLCNVKIKVTEYFGMDELEALRRLGLGPDTNSTDQQEGGIGGVSFTLQGHANDASDSNFGVLEPTQNYPSGHPGAGGRKWYMVQRVNGTDDGDAGGLEHKHTLEESDRIKKNSVQRWLIAQEKEKKKAAKSEAARAASVSDDENNVNEPPTPPLRFHATGSALQTLYSHTNPTSNNLTFYGCSYCPFAQRVWIALELIGAPYRYVEVTEKDWYIPVNAPPGTLRKCRITDLEEGNPEGKFPCIRHNNFTVWESRIMLEYLEDLAMGPSLFQPAVGNAQLKAHSRLWVDFIDRRILPVFYALLLLPDTENTSIGGLNQEGPINVADRNAHANPTTHGPNDERYKLINPSTYFPSRTQCDLSTLPHSIAALAPPSAAHSLRVRTLISTLHSTITTLVNASHRTGPFFLGPSLSYVDIAFAPWIIRLSRVLSYYRGFPQPEVGTRWQAWCDAIENNEIVRRTVSEDKNYREVYAGAAYTPDANGGYTTGWDYDDRGRVDIEKALGKNNNFPEITTARKLVESEGWGLGGDVWGHIAGEGAPYLT